MLTIKVLSHGLNEIRVGGANLVKDVFAYFGNSNIMKFRGEWVKGTKFDRNYNEFFELMEKQKLTPKEAPKQTWIGKLLAEQGLTEVEVATPTPGQEIVSPIFSRPTP